MSFDIHGNPLRRGHCEVHPHVAEEYPCFICIDDKRKYSIDRYRELELHKLKIAECTIARLVEALERLVFAAQCRDNSTGCQIRLIETREELKAATENAEEALASYRRQGGDV